MIFFQRTKLSKQGRDRDWHSYFPKEILFVLLYLGSFTLPLYLSTKLNEYAKWQNIAGSKKFFILSPIFECIKPELNFQNLSQFLWFSPFHQNMFQKTRPGFQNGDKFFRSDSDIFQKITGNKNLKWMQNLKPTFNKGTGILVQILWPSYLCNLIW